MRVRRPSRFSNRLFRARALVRSAGVLARLWWSISWHEKMWLVWIAENTPANEWPGFGAKAALGIRQAWVTQMTKQAGEAPTEWPTQIWTHVVRKRRGRLLIERLENGEVVYAMPECIVVHSRRPLWDLAGRLDAGADLTTAITGFEASMTDRKGE